jgi:Peptidase_C39 like family
VSSSAPSYPAVEVEAEAVPAGSSISEALSAIGLPDEVAHRWSRFASPLEVTVLSARFADQVSGAAVVVSRHLSASVKIGGLWTRPGDDAPAVEAALVSAAEELARRKGAIVVKRELDAAGSGDADRGGYELVPTPPMAGPAPSGESAIPAGSFRWTTDGNVAVVPYIRQTTEFTCGPSALLMALSYFGLHPTPDRSTEIGLWREATTVGGCDPYGMAVAAARHGLDVELTVTTSEFFLLEGLEEKEREFRRFIQGEFRDQAVAAGVKVAEQLFDASLIRDIIESGRIAIVLVDELLLHEEACPHWIVVHSLAGDLFVIHDPWTEVTAGESWLDAYNVPMSGADLERIDQTGDPSYGAVLAVGPRAD